MATAEKECLSLNDYRALDLTDDKGFLCGKILADLGIDVIKVEPPRGDPARKIGPFYKDIPHPEKSLNWFAYNANKRGITLDVGTRDGREIFKRLVQGSDFVIESYDRGYMDELGLGYKELSMINHRIIVTSILPFDPDGPYRDYKAPDIVGMAMGGVMFGTGEPERPPVRISFPQAYLQAGSQAAVGTMIAHYYRERTGKGQHVMVSMQASLAWALTNTIPWWELNSHILQRQGIYRAGVGAKVKLKLVWPCKDGLVSFIVIGGALRYMEDLVQWMGAEGMADEHLKTIKWGEFDMSKVTPSEIEEIEEKVGSFFSTYTKDDLYKEASKRHVPLAPVSDFADVLQNDQLRSRDYWVELDHPELKTRITYPGPFAKFSETPISIERRAPLIGEHNEEIYGKELGISTKELVVLKEGGII
ncbi:MAG: CoA transferase [Pseudomonadota bacterium]